MNNGGKSKEEISKFLMNLRRMKSKMENVDENEVVVPVNKREILQLDGVIKHLSGLTGEPEGEISESRVFLWCL